MNAEDLTSSVPTGHQINNVATNMTRKESVGDNGSANNVRVEVETVLHDDNVIDVEETEDFLRERLEETIDYPEVDGPTNTFEVHDTETFDPDYWMTADQVNGLNIPQNVPFQVPKPNEWTEDRRPKT